MIKTARAMRIHVGIFGRMNVGKSSLLNALVGQDVAITSNTPGTTTDVVEKTMEWLPFGSVVFMDTAGINDQSSLGHLRVKKTTSSFRRCDVALLVVESNVWGKEEDQIIEKLKGMSIPFCIVVSKVDKQRPDEKFLQHMKDVSQAHLVLAKILEEKNWEILRKSIQNHFMAICPESILQPTSLIGDLVPAGGLVVLVVPIDLQAPKGRLILPQVQTIRDLLDHDAAVLVVKEREYAAFLQRLPQPPDLVVCDSQIVLKMVADTPSYVKCTTFSTLFARFKGDLMTMVRGAARIHQLQSGDHVLIAEACTHHAMEDDIGRVKIPRWLRQYVGLDLQIDVFSGRDFPDDVTKYRLIIHCGSCMLNRRELMTRMMQAEENGVAITNYGVCISLIQGVLERILSPFPSVSETYGALSSSGYQ